MIDFHCHLDLYPDPSAVVNRTELSSMYVLAVTTTPAAWEGNQRLVKDKKRIRVALGLHPELVATRHHEIDRFIELLPETPYVGEIGVDGSPHLRPSFTKQEELFRKILRACREMGGRVLSIHSRQGATEVLNALSDECGTSTPILHWFSGTSKQLQRSIEMGCWFSVGPMMLRSAKGRDLARAMPRDRVLTETDAPFSTDRGVALMPWDVCEAEDALTAIWQLPKSAIQAQLLKNLRSLVRKVEMRSH